LQAIDPSLSLSTSCNEGYDTEIHWTRTSHFEVRVCGKSRASW